MNEVEEDVCAGDRGYGHEPMMIGKDRTECQRCKAIHKRERGNWVRDDEATA